MKKGVYFIILFGLIFHFNTFAQLNKAPVKIAVFAPIYINDAFDYSGTYIGEKTTLPKNVLPGLEFYNGVMMAIDSLEQEGITAEVSIYDTKNSTEFTQLLQGGALNNTNLIIAALTNSAELRSLANVALQRNIPLISATYPNNGNVTANPEFVMLNSSLQAHVEGLYKYLQKNYGYENIIFLKRSGATETYIKNIFTELNKNTRSVPLKIKWVELTDTFYTYQVTRYMDSVKKNIMVVASPSESFGLRVVKSANTMDNYNSVIIGMPTWDGIKELNNPGFKNIEIIYSTPFHYSPYDKIASSLTTKYKAKYNSRPSDMAFKGFETMYHFTKLLIKNGDLFIDKISDTDYTLFNHFDIVPVKLKKGNEKPDYYENKKLYFVRKQEGEVVVTN